MSHFFVGVIVKDEETAEAELEKVMSPYDEGISVDEYDQDCYCIGGEARCEINKQIDEKFGNMEKVRGDFWKMINLTAEKFHGKDWLNTEEGQKFIDKEWKKVVNPRIKATELLEESHDGIHKADVECEECNGTGKRKTTYNPKSKWDWYTVGGRWDGMIKNARAESEDGGFNFGANHRDKNQNIISVKEYLKIAKKNPDKVVPFALVTPEGEWIEKGQMGWWAMVSNEKDEDRWLNEAIGIVKKYPDHYILGVDCHI